MQDGSLIPRFGRARRDSQLAVLEGFHPLKHALRFGAELEEVVTSDPERLDALAAQLAPELRADIAALARAVPDDVFRRLAPLPPATGVISLARRPAVDAAAALAGDRRVLVLLEDPRDLGNMGACVRVAAAADAGGVLTTGTHDPWHPDAVRGAAGLHFALPVARLEHLSMLDGDRGGRALIAFDPDGEELRPDALDPGAILAFGTERHGLSDELADRADARVSIPMRAGVSSLNLATSVAAVLFAQRFARARPA